MDGLRICSLQMVSIIIPHYNRAGLLKDTVNSVLNQSSPDWELIIVDDGSDEKEFVSIMLLTDEDTRISVYSRISDQKGPSACRNEGVARAKGEWLIFLDSDDALAPFCVEQRQRLMKENSELDIGVFLMQEFTNIPGDNQKIYNHSSTNENRVNCFLEGNNAWAVTCPIWRKDFFIQVGAFDPSFFYMEDPELHIRALLQDNMMYKTFYDFPTDCYYRTNFHDATKKHFYENSIRYRIKFYKKMENLISVKSELFEQYKNSFNQGVVYFFNHFLISRVTQFPALQQEFMEWAKESQLLSKLIVFSDSELHHLFQQTSWMAS